jgi:ribonuclease P protein component
MLPKKYRLPKHCILPLIQTGRKIFLKDIRCIYAFSKEKHSRFALIIKLQGPKSSVKRSRNKRTVQTAILLYLNKLRSPCDMVIFVYGKDHMHSPLDAQIQELFQTITPDV